MKCLESNRSGRPILERRGAAGKVRGYAELVTEALGGRVLDVGCRSMELAGFVPGQYVGVDIDGSPHVFADLGRGLPFPDQSFHVVLALDVLEHVDDIYGAFAESTRVAAECVVVALPNVFVRNHRISLLLGRQPSGKYGLPADPPQDRHRWVLSYRESIDFVRHQATGNGFRVTEDGPGFFEYRRVLPRGVIAMGRRFGPDRVAPLLASRYWAALRRESAS